MPTTKTELNSIKSSLDPNNPQKQSQQKLYIVGITILFVIVCILSIIRILFPPKVTIRESPTVTRNADFSQTEFTSIRFTGELPVFPEELPVARISEQSISNQAAIDALINRYQLVRKSLQIRIWASDNHLLTYDPSVDTYTFLVSEFNPEEVLPKVDRRIAVATAQEYLGILLPKNQLSVLENAVTFHNLSQEITDSSEADATAVRVPFAPTINDIPVFFEKYADYPFVVIVDGKNEIRRVIFHPQLQKYETFDTLPLISIEQAFENMKQGKNAIITAKYLGEEPVELDELTSAELSDVRLEYRDDTGQGLIYPFFRFSGKATRTDGEGVELQVITPAIQTRSTPAR